MKGNCISQLVCTLIPIYVPGILHFVGLMVRRWKSIENPLTSYSISIENQLNTNWKSIQHQCKNHLISMQNIFEIHWTSIQNPCNINSTLIQKQLIIHSKCIQHSLKRLVQNQFRVDSKSIQPPFKINWNSFEIQLSGR